MKNVGSSPARLSDLPEYLTAMVRRTPPVGAPVVSGSTPVVAFGNPARAEVATLGINPSAREFFARGRLLTGTNRRLATLESLGAERLDRLTDDQVATVVAECATYFDRRPYRRWFDPLEQLLTTGYGVSFYDGSACHLDLVQWATDPTWGRIPERRIRHSLLEDGVPHLRAQLARENVRVVLLNGRQVVEQVLALRVAELDEVGHLPLGTRTCRLYVGTGEGLRWAGWSTNLQSSYGVSGDFKNLLGAWLAGLSNPPSEPSGRAVSGPRSEVDADGHLPRGLRVDGKAELVNVLSRWLTESGASTVGDVGTFGGRPWLIIGVGRQLVALNADTKRAAVETFVRGSRPNPDRPWRVIANNRGRVNKVLPGPGPEPLPGWYAYLTRPMVAEGSI